MSQPCMFAVLGADAACLVQAGPLMHAASVGVFVLVPYDAGLEGGSLVVACKDPHGATCRRSFMGLHSKAEV